MSVQAQLLLGLCAMGLICSGCRDIDPGVTPNHIRELESALEATLAKDTLVSWNSLDVEERKDGDLKIRGSFWAQLKKDSVRLSHRLKATFAASSGELIDLTIDGVPFSAEQTLSRLWDRIQEYNPEKKFEHLSEAEKNSLWWRINHSVVSDRREGSTTLTWPMHELLLLTNEYDVTPLDLSEFFDFGYQAAWRTERAPELMTGPRTDFPPAQETPPKK